jgi:hypothetical protein
MTRWVLPFALAVMLGARSVPPQAMTDIDGRAWPLLTPAKGTTHVLVFVGTECPISNRYAPELGRIATTYAAKGVRTFLIYEDPAIEAARVRKHRAEFYAGLELPALIDREAALARAVGAKATPTAAVYSPAGRVYRGRIDDLYLSLTQSRREPTERTLRLSLDAVLAGRPAPKPETQAVGCSIGGSS